SVHCDVHGSITSKTPAAAHTKTNNSTSSLCIQICPRVTGLGAFCFPASADVSGACADATPAGPEARLCPWDVLESGIRPGSAGQRVAQIGTDRGAVERPSGYFTTSGP